MSEKPPNSVTRILAAFCIIDGQTLLHESIRCQPRNAASHRPWPAELTPNCFIVRDADGQQLVYVYYENEPSRRLAAKLLTKDEARWIAETA